MSKARFGALTLAVALLLTSGSAVMAQEASPEAMASPDATTSETFDPMSVPEFNRDEALILYIQFRERMLAMGVSADQMDEAVAYLESEYQSLSPDEQEQLSSAESSADEAEAEMDSLEEQVRDEADLSPDDLEEESDG